MNRPSTGLVGLPFHKDIQVARFPSPPHPEAGREDLLLFVTETCSYVNRGSSARSQQVCLPLKFSAGVFRCRKAGCYVYSTYWCIAP